jgi:predicted nucleic acid-binding protein
MKSANLPQVRVEPELRAQLESVLRDGETLSGFVEATVRSAVEYRRAQAEFHARGEAAWEAFRRSGVSHPAGEVIAELRGKLEARRKRLQAADRRKK